jgi:hypothetical protein
MNCAVEMGSTAMIYSYIPSSIKTGSGIQKLMGRGLFTNTDAQTYRHTESMEIAEAYFRKIG